LTERVDEDRRLPAASAFRDVFALEMAFSRARSCSCLSRDMDTPNTLAVFRAVAKRALISVAIDHILQRHLTNFRRGNQERASGAAYDCGIWGGVAMSATNTFRRSVAPWLSVRGSARALAFYKAAFGAVEVYRLDGPDESVVARLSIDGSEFWMSDESPEHKNFSPETLGGGTAKMVLIVEDVDEAFARAIAAGATEVHPVGEGHGWRIGRVVDPFGHHWEIAREVGGK
jgi:PhnB protein